MPRQTLVHTEILRTCEVLRDEGHHFLYTYNYFELRVVLNQPDWRGYMLDLLPVASIRPGLLRSLRLKVEMAQWWELGYTFDWSGLRMFENLKELLVAVTRRVGKCESYPSNSDIWKECPVVNYIIKGIVEHVSCQVELKWGGWDALPVDGDTEQELFPWREDRTMVIDGHFLEEVAQYYEDLRGRKIVVQENGKVENS